MYYQNHHTNHRKHYNHHNKIPRKNRHNNHIGNGYDNNNNSSIEVDITFTEIIATISIPQSLFAKRGYKPRLQQLRELEKEKKYGH
jgi:hypothetical protein